MFLMYMFCSFLIFPLAIAIAIRARATENLIYWDDPGRPKLRKAGYLLCLLFFISGILGVIYITHQINYNYTTKIVYTEVNSISSGGVDVTFQNPVNIKYTYHIPKNKYLRNLSIIASEEVMNAKSN